MTTYGYSNYNNETANENEVSNKIPTNEELETTPILDENGNVIAEQSKQEMDNAHSQLIQDSNFAPKKENHQQSSHRIIRAIFRNYCFCNS